MWIDRIVTESEDESSVLELHRRLTVIASPDQPRRRAAYERVYQALKGIKGSHLDVQTSNGDKAIAIRPSEGPATLIDAANDIPISPLQLKRMGLVGQLNDAEAMTAHLRLLHVTADSLKRRAEADIDMINLAQTPLDQLWTLANAIHADQEILQMTEAQGDSLHAAAAQRDAAEDEITGILDRKAENDKLNQLFYVGATVSLGAAALASMAIQPLAGIPFVLIAVGLFVAGALIARNQKLLAEHQQMTETYGGSSLGLALERVDELFDNHSISRKQREAQNNLNRSVGQWRELAGQASPEVLIRERPRLEELAGHLRVINNEHTEVDPAEKEILIGFASLLAELSRRFEAECVPLLIDDLFVDVHPAYHNVLRELITRAAHRRQVVLETGDPAATQWAAAELVTGDALLITDQEVELPSLGVSEDEPQQAV